MDMTATPRYNANGRVALAAFYNKQRAKKSRKKAAFCLPAAI
jgi:hypothetical protein